MGTRIRFTKAAPKPKKPAQSDSVKETLRRLSSFLDQAEPEAVEFLFRDLQKAGNAVTYKELREAYLSGGLSQEQFNKWQHEYSHIVTDTLKPIWEQEAALAAQEIKNQYPLFFYEPGTSAAMSFINEHGAELVTNLARDQMDAINAMVAHCSGYTAITPDEMARIIRPCIGLTKPQALANLRYREKVQTALLEANPKMRIQTAAKKAAEAAAKYAGKQHRYRAMCIARTELAFGYNAGAFGATKDAQAQGYIGDCKKVWLTAYDKRVCPICSKMDGEKRDMDKHFSNGKLLPPAHPHCRCAVAYEEIDDKPLTDNERNAIILIEKIKNGELSLKINGDTQKPHMALTRKEGKSYFKPNVTIEYLQNFLNENYGTGTVIISNGGQIKEVFECDYDLGVDVAEHTLLETSTNKMTVHYSKRRTHCVPAKKRGGN